MLSHVPLFATPCSVVHQVPLSMEFSSQEYWSGLPFPSPGDLPDAGIETVSLASPVLADEFFSICASSEWDNIALLSFNIWGYISSLIPNISNFPFSVFSLLFWALLMFLVFVFHCRYFTDF